MFERHNTKVAIFGGKPGEQLQYKGMAGNQVLEWVDLDDEIKTANVKDVRAFLFCFLRESEVHERICCCSRLWRRRICWSMLI